MVNISVDSKDPLSNYFHEDLSINDQESILEILIEKVLGFEYAFEENEDHDSDNHQVSLEKSSAIGFLCANFNAFFFCKDEEKQKHFPNYLLNIKDGFSRNITPPPQIDLMLS